MHLSSEGAIPKSLLISQCHKGRSKLLILKASRESADNLKMSCKCLHLFLASSMEAESVRDREGFTLFCLFYLEAEFLSVELSLIVVRNLVCNRTV